MNEKEILDILKIILRCFSENKLNWRLGGSANLLVLGLNKKVKDLDITTDKVGLDIIRDSLKIYVIRDFYNEKIKSHSIICDINGFELEINAYDDKKFGMLDKTKMIKWDGLRIPVLPLESALEFYKIIRREDKIKLISDYLASR